MVIPEVFLSRRTKRSKAVGTGRSGGDSGQHGFGMKSEILQRKGVEVIDLSRGLLDLRGMPFIIVCPSLELVPLGKVL